MPLRHHTKYDISRIFMTTMHPATQKPNLRCRESHGAGHRVHTGAAVASPRQCRCFHAHGTETGQPTTMPSATTTRRPERAQRCRRECTRVGRRRTLATRRPLLQHESMRPGRRLRDTLSCKEPEIQPPPTTPPPPPSLPPPMPQTSPPLPMPPPPSALSCSRARGPCHRGSRSHRA